MRSRAEPAAGRGDERREGVLRQQPAAVLGLDRVVRGVLVALRAEDLADLEEVVAGAAVERGDRGRVVDVEASLPPSRRRSGVR
jgi:hypothetical protein